MMTHSSEIVVEQCVTPQGLLRNVRIGWDPCGLISELSPDCPPIYVEPYLAVPGLIDSHLHGFAGVNLLNRTPTGADWQLLDKRLLAHGITGYLAGICCRSPEMLAAMVDSAQQAGPEGFLGFYCEGPFVNPVSAGALPRDCLSEINHGLCRELLGAGKGLIRVMMLSPELAGACKLIAELRSNHVIPSLGHSQADAGQTRNAIQAGAQRITHWPNALKWGDHHQPAIGLLALTEDRLVVEIIPDGDHVSSVLIDIAARCKADKLIAVSDTMPVAGLAYNSELLSQTGLEFKDGRLVLKGTAIHAGAVAPLDEGLGKLVRSVSLSISYASRMCATNVAASLGLIDRGELAVGKRADFILMDSNLKVAGVFRKGGERTL